jgi:decaprenylphospho-beta-D-ribofuranose 2-oxidase
MATATEPVTSREVLTGFGGVRRCETSVLRSASPDRLRELIAARPAGGLVARGAGLSYGDAAQNSTGVVVSPAAGAAIRLDRMAQTVTAAATTTFAEVLRRIVPAGFILPVLPESAHVTVGGAIAADVHGRNHAAAGSLSAWVDQVELIDGTGSLRTLTMAADPEGLRATLGGMGLTGIILSATIRLLPVESSMLRVVSDRTADLDATLSLLAGSAAQYAVARVDATASGAALGRGVVDCADHAGLADLPAADQRLAYRQRTPLQVPAVPLPLLTPLSARAINTARFRRAPASRSGLTDIAAFFHRLDLVQGWNRAAARAGLIRYQLAVPAGAETVLASVLENLRRNNCAPVLGTLMRLGPADGGPLSLAVPGWCLAVDIPAGQYRLGQLLTWLDMQVAGAGGRVGLAEDTRLGEYAFNAMYGPVSDWRDARARLDPHGLFQSDLGRRVGLC